MTSEEATRKNADEYVDVFTNLADVAETGARLLWEYANSSRLDRAHAARASQHIYNALNKLMGL